MIDFIYANMFWWMLGLLWIWVCYYVMDYTLGAFGRLWSSIATVFMIICMFVGPLSYLPATQFMFWWGVIVSLPYILISLVTIEMLKSLFR